MTDLVPADWALTYAGLGWTVMPLRRADNIPHPMLKRGWSFDWIGSTDPAVVTPWWTTGQWWRWWPWTEHVRRDDGVGEIVHPASFEDGDPAANIGIVCGARSRLLVLDVDTKKGDGLESIRNESFGEKLLGIETARSQTPSGGMHIWFRLPDDVKDVRRKVGWLRNVDACGSGGFVAAPPSCKLQHVRSPKPWEPGTRELLEYRWTDGNFRELAEAPRWLLRDVIERRPEVIQPSRDKDPLVVVGQAPKLDEFYENGFGWYSGSRNRDCYVVSQRLWALGYSEAEVVAFVMRCLDKTNQSLNTDGDLDPFSWDEAYRTIRSAARYVPDKQREAVETLKAWKGE